MLLGLVVAMIAIAALAILFRYDISARSYGVIRFDRWTGATSICTYGACTTFKDVPPSVSVKMPSEDLLVFPEGSPKSEMEKVAKRVWACQKSAKTDPARAACYTPSENEAKRGLRFEHKAP